jgi:DNA polymerase-4
MASDMQKPNGLVWVSKNEIPQKMGHLSIRAVPGIGPRMEAHLNRSGLYKISDLLKLTPGQARAAWGSIVGVRTVQAVQGEPYVYEHGDRKSIGHEHVLPPDLRTPEKAFSIALKLLDKACIRLRKNHERCKKMGLSVRFADSQYFEKSIQFSATSDTGFLMKQLQELWKFNPSAPPFKVSIVLTELEEEGLQLSFFDQENSRREKAYQIADRLNEKFGKNTIFVSNLSEMKDKPTGGIAFSRVPKKDEF